MLEKHAQKIILVLLIIIPAIVWQGVTSNGFVWDDVDIYFNQSKFDRNADFNDLAKFWNPIHNANENMYMPLTYTIWFVSGKISGDNGKIHFDPVLLHSLNLAVHISNGILVFLILQLLLSDRWRAFAGAFIFSLHPIQVEAVTWVSELRGLLAALFGFLSILMFLKFLINKSEKIDFYYMASILAFVFSLLSKPSAVSFSLLIFLTALFFGKFGFKKALLLTIPYFILVVPIAIRANAAESIMPYVFGGPIWARPLIYLDSFTFYLKNLIFPVGLVADYGRKPEFVINTMFFFFSWIIPLGSGIFLYLNRKKYKIYLFSFLLFISAFITVSGLVSFYFQDWSTVADRYIYVSMLGAGLSFGYFLTKFNAKTGIIITAVVSIALIVLTIQQIKVWENEITLWDNNISKFPDRSAHAYNGRGFEYMKLGKYNPALMDFNNAIELDPNYNRAYYNRGNIFFDAGEFQKAIDDYSKAIELKANNPNYLANRGLAYSENNEPDKALEDFNAALKIDSNQYDVYINRAIVFAEKGNWEPAKNDFLKALELRPNDAQVINYLKMVDEEILKSKQK